MEEDRLIGKAKNGDAAAYERLVRTHQEVAFRVAYEITRDASEAEDAAQEAFVKAYRALGRFRAGSPFRPWLLAIVSNEAKNRRKAAGRRMGLAVRAERGGVLAVSHPSPEADVLTSERREELLAVVGALRDEDRVVISCRYFLDLSEKEIAAALGCARGTVKSRLSRAMSRLRERMVKDAG